MNAPRPGSNLRRGVRGDDVLSFFNEKPPFFVDFCPEKRQHPEIWMLPQLLQKGKEKDAPSVLLRLFSVLLTVLSILILTYKDLRFNSKTLPMLRQNRANYLPPASKMYP